MFAHTFIHSHNPLRPYETNLDTYIHDGADSRGQVTFPKPQDKQMMAGSLFPSLTATNRPSQWLCSSSVSPSFEIVNWYTTDLNAAFTINPTDRDPQSWHTLCALVQAAKPNSKWPCTYQQSATGKCNPKSTWLLPVFSCWGSISYPKEKLVAKAPNNASPSTRQYRQRGHIPLYHTPCSTGTPHLSQDFLCLQDVSDHVSNKITNVIN